MYSKEWVDMFTNIAVAASGKSKDPSTKVGAVLIRPDKTIAGVGFNGYPARITDNPHHSREDRLLRTVHAEKNALAFIRDTTMTGYTMVVTHHPCADCALDIANTGITQVLYRKNPDFDERWKESTEKAKAIFEEARIELIAIPD